MKLWAFENPQFLYGDCMKPGCTGKSNTDNLTAPTDLTKNPYTKKTFFFKKKYATQKSAPLVLDGITL
jgi:hypothetical protein